MSEGEKKTTSLKDLILDLKQRAIADVDGDLPIFIGHVGASKVRSMTPTDAEPRALGLKIVRDLSFRTMDGDDVLSAEEFELLTEEQLQLLARQIAKRSQLSHSAEDQVEGLGASVLEKARELSELPSFRVTDDFTRSISENMLEIGKLNERLRTFKSSAIDELAQAAAGASAIGSAALGPREFGFGAAADLARQFTEHSSAIERARNAAASAALHGAHAGSLEITARDALSRAMKDDLPNLSLPEFRAEIPMIERDRFILPDIDFSNTHQSRAADAGEDAAEKLEVVANTLAQMGEEINKLTGKIVNEAIPQWRVQAAEDRDQMERSFEKTSSTLRWTIAALVISVAMNLFQTYLSRHDGIDSAIRADAEEAMMRAQIQQMKDIRYELMGQSYEQRMQTEFLKELFTQGGGLRYEPQTP